MWTTCHPILKKKQKFHYKKKKKERKRKKRKRKAYALSLTYFPISLKTKNKSSSPQVKHNLTSKFSSTKGREEWNTAFTSSADLVYFVIQTGIRKSNLNKTRLNVIVKNKTKQKNPKTPTKKKKNPKTKQTPPHTVDLVWYRLILRVKLLLSPLNTLLQFIYWWLEYLLT